MAYKRIYFELFITFIWIVILSDYVAVEGATYNDLQWAKDFKNLNLPIMFGAYLLDFKNFKVHSVLFKKFALFFLFSFVSLIYSIKFDVGVQKTISFVLLYLLIPEFFMKIFLNRLKEMSMWFRFVGDGHLFKTRARFEQASCNEEGPSFFNTAQSLVILRDSPLQNVIAHPTSNGSDPTLSVHIACAVKVVLCSLLEVRNVPCLHLPTHQTKVPCL